MVQSVKTDSTDEKALLKGLALNDRKSVETIYKLFYNMVQTLIINNNGSADDARDIFQETVILIYENAKRGSFKLNCQLKTYVYSVSRRLSLKKLQQQQKYIPNITGLEEAVPVEEEVDTHNQLNTEFQMMEKAL